MNETKDESTIGKRPIIITIFCILGFLGSAPMLLGLLLPAARAQLITQYGSIMIPISASTFILGLSGIIGYWKMRKWGIYIYSVMAIISIGSGILLNMQTGIISYIMPVVIIVIGIIYYKRMT